MSADLAIELGELALAEMAGTNTTPPPPKPKIPREIPIPPPTPKQTTRKPNVIPATKSAEVTPADGRKEEPKASGDDMRGIIRERLILHSSPPPKPIPILSLGGLTVSTAGNLSSLQGPPKGGKSSALAAAIAAAIGGPWESDMLGFSAKENTEGHAIIWLDSEQSPFDAWNLLHRAMRRAEVQEQPPWVQMLSIADLPTATRRRLLTEAMEMATEQYGGIFMVILDGVADLLADPNDPIQAFGLVEELHGLAIRFNCPILSVLHENPGSETGKSRGHLGSQLERKAETILRIKTNPAGESCLFAHRARRGHLPESDAIWFKWDQESKMHLRFIRQPASREDRNVTTFRNRAQGVFGLESVLSWGQIVARLIQSGTKRRTAEDQISRWVSKGIVKQTPMGYELQSPVFPENEED